MHSCKPSLIVPMISEQLSLQETFPGVSGNRLEISRFHPRDLSRRRSGILHYMTSSLGFTGSVRRMIRSLSTDVTPLTFRKKVMASWMSFPSGILMAIPGMRL